MSGHSAAVVHHPHMSDGEFREDEACSEVAVDCVVLET